VPALTLQIQKVAKLLLEIHASFHLHLVALLTTSALHKVESFGVKMLLEIGETAMALVHKNFYGNNFLIVLYNFIGKHLEFSVMIVTYFM